MFYFYFKLPSASIQNLWLHIHWWNAVAVKWYSMSFWCEQWEIYIILTGIVIYTQCYSNRYSTCCSLTGGATLSSPMWSSSGKVRPTGFTTALSSPSPQKEEASSENFSTLQREAGCTSGCRHDDLLLDQPHLKFNLKSSNCICLPLLLV